MAKQACLLLTALVVLCMAERGRSASPTAATADGYRGIWYISGNKEYGGGFALFPAQHSPSAIYGAQAKKTFFVYGGTVAGRRQLQAMVSYYDHQRDVVPRPTIVHDWGAGGLKPAQAADAHRNPTLALDGDGRVWVFVSGHGDAGYVYRAKEPHRVDQFELAAATPMTYPNPWWIPQRGFFVFFTKYDHHRESFWTTAADGRRLADAVTWSKPGQLNAWTVGRDGPRYGHGNYQYTAACGTRVATVMNNWIGRTRDRSNLFYLQSDDMGRTWQTADGKDFTPPVREVKCAALVRDFWGERLQVYVQHLTFDRQRRPVILVLTAPAGQTREGPGGSRTWTVVHWLGDRWAFHPVTTSSNNFDCGTLYTEDDREWRIIGPTEPGPQRWRTGGEIALWVSRDQGASWQKARQLTAGSKSNHAYVRRPVDAQPDFYALWADGDGNDPGSPSRLYFCNRAGEVRVLPPAMSAAVVRPKRLAECQE
jgi:hypothetical protein